MAIKSYKPTTPSRRHMTVSAFEGVDKKAKPERSLLENLKKTRAGKTTILIAHRISTIEQMDKIIMVEDGRIEAVGTHEALYRSCPSYRTMVELQKLEEEGGEQHA